VPVDFYDGSMLYDFESDEFHICDIDFYRKMPAVNDMGRMWGSERFMAPEEYELGAPLDEIKAVHNMGTTMYELLCITDKDAYDINHSFDKWSASKALYDVAAKASLVKRDMRYQTLEELSIAWNMAKKANDICYRQLSSYDLSPDMLNHFNRYQKVDKLWMKKDGKLVLVDESYIENWDEAKKQKVISVNFTRIINTGGALLGAYDSDKLIGFCCFDGCRVGSRGQYLQLVYLHVSYEYRNKGIGRKLFALTSDNAKTRNVEKLYISANDSMETQAFYRSMGCVEAEEIISAIADAEPYDIQMEFLL
jgi:ribosomal protein S18 acetylase RimI-like enzyme